MQSKHVSLSPANLLFPLALVLFEFAVYIANDMVQPAMLQVTREFMVNTSWVPTSMTAFLIGGAVLPWLTGPLSDRIGRRPVLLFGVAYFMLACLASYLVHSIESFIALRVLQGMGLCFINAVGYAAVQEAFEETAAVKVTALMANVALIAPLVGPLAGAALVEIAPWRSCFLVIAAMSFIALLGLIWKMPETVQPSHDKLPLSQMGRDYLRLFSQRRFLLSALCIPLLALPLMGWIALSPVLLVQDLGMSTLQYGLMQLPVFGGLIAGNFALVLLADRWPLGRSVFVGMGPIVSGLLLMLGGVLFAAEPVWLMVAGMSLMSFGEGLSFGVLYRFALMSSPVAKGTVSASMSMLSMAGYALGIEIFRVAYLLGGMAGFAACSVLTALLFVQLARSTVPQAMAERAAPADYLPPELQTQNS
ncbi:MdfA family multidrug efflux MFS transporter [Aquitalea palustris]|uniref:MdfA family multidrug efflux MFS transporter n=1 Tax=Aquitalea palustris TaxID=2480983 RepID=A0A454JJL1_9NEIS|nr:MFS transporter [Aquitalea palustris]RMC99169.1 MdfA family multidrug efflux MFS transporter [Aquitalea palustris]